jgi:hypothetical protein
MPCAITEDAADANERMPRGNQPRSHRVALFWPIIEVGMAWVRFSNKRLPVSAAFCCRHAEYVREFEVVAHQKETTLFASP